MEYFIGIDIGTSGTKALLIDDSGKLIASATSDYPSYNPQPGFSEQEAVDWWDATAESVRKILSSADVSKDDVKGIGLSGQMHGAVFLDDKNNVLRRPILGVHFEQARHGTLIIHLSLVQGVCIPRYTGFLKCLS